jgi:acyl-CoA reductase-like NAD-dependent aldehyde dehydrogenase
VLGQGCGLWCCRCRSCGHQGPRAFDDGRWSRLHPKERKESLIRLVKLIRRNARELAVMEAWTAARRYSTAKQLMCLKQSTA